MNKQMLQKVLRLSQECLSRFWQLDPEFAIRHFDKNIVWIGSAKSQYTDTYEETVKDFREIMKELKPCHLSHQEFMVAQNVGNACTIVGRYVTTTDNSVGYFLQAQQRCTFVWEVEQGEPKIKHCHISNPMGELKLAEGEKFVNALGEMTKKYWAYRLRTLQNKHQILINDNKDTTHFFLPSEILYVNAVGRNCIIYTTEGGEIYSRSSIADFYKDAGADFSFVHRSYVVNNAYISSIRPYEIIMDDGSQIPVPKRRYNEIKKMLIAFDD